MGFRNERPPAASAAIYNLMLTCWSVDPCARPTFVQLASALGEEIGRSTSSTSSDSSSSSSSAFPSRSASSTVSSETSASIVYLALHNPPATTITSSNASLAETTTPASLPSTLTDNLQRLSLSSTVVEDVGGVGAGGRDGPRASVLVNSCYVDRTQYLQNLHKAFVMPCNYVIVSEIPRRNATALMCLN